MHYILFLLALMFAHVAQAMDCEKIPDCEKLGYSTESEPNCADNGYMYCPFDKTYKKCVQYNCEALGFTDSDKTSWCGKIISCRTDKKFTACKALCEIGDVYYSDGTCGYAKDYDGKKIPIGVVYYVSDGGTHGKVINLHDLSRASSRASFDPANPYQTNNKTFTWGVRGTDISGLTNWECSGSNNNYLTVAKTGDHSNPFWSAGESYTDLIVKALGNDSLKYAAGAAYAFYPPEVSEDDPIVGQGKWYLPTLGELMDLYGYNYTSGLGNCETSTGANGNTKQKVNETLNALKNKDVVSQQLTDNGYYWSSSEYNSNDSWLLYMVNGTRDCHPKEGSGTYYVRASLEF